MNVDRGDLELVGDASGVVIARWRTDEAIHVTGDELRYLQAVAIPTLLAVPPVPSEDDVKIRDASEDDGQIRGQLAIEG